MISPGNIAFDIDGVFADTMGLFLQIAREEYGVNHIGYEDITSYFLEDCLDLDPELIRTIINRILDGDFKAQLRPIDGAVEVLRELVDAAPLLFVTARPTRLPIQDWVESVLSPSGGRLDVIATGTFEAKGDVLKARGIEYFVEDHLEVCSLLKEQGISPIVFEQPWNRVDHPFRRVKTWAEVRALLDLAA